MQHSVSLNTHSKHYKHNVYHNCEWVLKNTMNLNQQMWRGGGHHALFLVPNGIQIILNNNKKEHLKNKSPPEMLLLHELSIPNLNPSAKWFTLINEPEPPWMLQTNLLTFSYIATTGSYSHCWQVNLYFEGNLKGNQKKLVSR